MLLHSLCFPLLPHITYPGIYKSSLPTDTKASQNSQQDIKVVTRQTVPYLSRGVSSAQSGNCLKSEDPQNGPFAYSETLTEVPRVPPSELCPQTEEEKNRDKIVVKLFFILKCLPNVTREW